MAEHAEQVNSGKPLPQPAARPAAGVELDADQQTEDTYVTHELLEARPSCSNWVKSAPKSATWREISDSSASRRTLSTFAYPWS